MVAVTAVIVGTFVLTVFERRRHRELAKTRPALSKCEFMSLMADGGVRNDTAAFLWNEVADWYFGPLRPHPDDRWESVMRFDPEDLEDLTAKFWKSNRWIQPWREDPITLPNDPSLLEFGRWLDDQRQLH